MTFLSLAEGVDKRVCGLSRGPETDNSTASFGDAV